MELPPLIDYDCEAHAIVIGTVDAKRYQGRLYLFREVIEAGVFPGVYLPVQRRWLCS
jgi:hypothetical protein